MFVEPANDWSSGLRRGDMSQFAARRGAWSPAGLENILVVRPVKVAPKSWRLGRAINARLSARLIQAQLRRNGWSEPVLWINDHGSHHLAGRFGSIATIYDITDDWTACESNPDYKRVIEMQDDDLCRRADEVIGCSEKLADLKQQFVRPDHLHLIPNGVDANHYRMVLDGDGPLPTDTAQWPRPVFGYTGTVHPDRVDVSLVEHLAKSTDGSVVLLGPNHLLEKDLRRLNALGNAYMPGPRPYQQIPQYMRAFDVCITPHRMTPFTESLNPIKLWEYLAAGKPIVSTDVAGFRDYPELVSLARSPGEFIAACQMALREGTAKCDRRRDEARKHSWKSRVDEIERVIAGSIRHRSGREAILA